MSNSRGTVICSFVIFVCIVNQIHGYYIPNRFYQNAVNRLQDSRFDGNENLEDYPVEDIERMYDSGMNPLFFSLDTENYKSPSRRASSPPLEGLDQQIKWNSSWGSNLNLGQATAVSIDPNGNIAVFHRGSRVWDMGSFDQNDKFDFNNNHGPVKENTIVLLDKNGYPILSWGKNMFYMPHGLTIDHLGNYWITDVAMHQVFKFDAKDIEKNKNLLKADTGSNINVDKYPDLTNLFKNSIIKPSLSLGTAFAPGNGEESFCKPTSVAVMKNGDFFVADGYCNSRIIKFNSKGDRILTWGHGSIERNPSPYSFMIPHALALAEEFGYLFLADREHDRVLCFHAANGTIHKEYKNDRIEGSVYSVAYAKEQLFLVNGPEARNIRGFIVEISTNKILSEFAPNEQMARPHDIAVTPDGREIYVVELDTKRVTRFDRGPN